MVPNEFNEQVLNDELAVERGRAAKDGLGLVGRVRIEHRGATGDLLGEREFKNAIANTGRGGIANHILGNITTPFKAIGVGTGVVAATWSDTALGTEVFTRVWGAGTVQVTDTASDTAQVVGTFTFTANTFAITECGLFDNTPTGGTLLARQAFAALNVAVGDSLQITWKIDID